MKSSQGIVTMRNKTQKHALSGEVVRKTAFLLILLTVVAVEIWYRLCDSPDEFISDCYNSALRFCGALAALVFMLEFSFGKILNPLGNKRLKTFIFVLPALAVAINNFPWVSFFMGDCTLDADVSELLFYAIICICVGLFEEFAFRGCVLMLFLKKRRTTRQGVFMAIFWSSVIFGAVHLVNIFVSSPGAVFLQIGYSALIGALCSMVLLETGNIWICVIVHALYNFAGGVVPRLGDGVIWTAPEVAVTAVLGVLAAIISVWRFFKLPLERTEELFIKTNKNEKEKDDNI